MRRILVVANETVAGRALIDEVRRRAEEGDVRFHLVVPRQRPSHGNVIYEDAVRGAARVRIDLATRWLAGEGIEATGEVGDEDPFNATMDAVHTFGPDEIIISTHPATISGWLRRDLVERVQDATDVPVHHVVVDLDAEGTPFHVTLVVANRTTQADELVDVLKRQAERDGNRIFICVVPQDDGAGRSARVAAQRLQGLLARLREAGLLAGGMIGDPDPYTATRNALQLFRVDEVVISTLPGERSGWLRSDLVERVRKVTDAHVEHVEIEPERSVA